MDIRSQDETFRPALQASVLLDDINAALNHQSVPVELHGESVKVTGLAMDSRTVRPGDLYAALPGSTVHGAQFIEQAIASGAVAVLTDTAGEAGIDKTIPRLIVENVRAAVGIVAQQIYNNGEGQKPQLYGITGTNGKTTTSYFLRALLEKIQIHTGIIGTIEIQMGAEPIPSRFTTPEAAQLHALLAKMRENDVDAVAMEVSSHAIGFNRTAGLKFRVAGFTNLTQDHLDYHGTMQEYFETKAKLLNQEVSQISVVTLNGGLEPHWGLAMAKKATGEVVTLDLGETASVQLPPEHSQELAQADWMVEAVEEYGLGSRFTLTHREGFQLRTSVEMPGKFNVANAALATVMVLASQPRNSWQDIAKILDPTTTDTVFASVVPGRMQVIAKKPATIVDFAHNPGAMSEALKAVNRVRPQNGKVIMVFGATGERDTAKRPLMAQVAVEGADTIIITDDDPFGEDPAPIRETLTQAALQHAKKLNKNVTVIEVAPREQALQKAVELVNENDVILAAGRGHETTQDFAGTTVHLDDAVALREALTCNGWVTNPEPNGAEAPNSANV